MGTITSANSVFVLTITDLYTLPQQLQGYDVDDAFATEAIDTAELKMGVDGKLSAGFVFVPVPTTVTLQADSSSISLFEAWYAAEKAAKEKYPANGVITFESIGRAYTLTNGYLTNYPVFSDAKKILQPRKFGITWETIIGAAI